MEFVFIKNPFPKVVKSDDKKTGTF